MKAYSLREVNGYREGRAVVVYLIMEDNKRAIAETLSNADACNVCRALNHSEAIIWDEFNKMCKRVEDAQDEHTQTVFFMPDSCVHETCGHNVEDGPEIGVIYAVGIGGEDERLSRSK